MAFIGTRGALVLEKKGSMFVVIVIYFTSGHFDATVYCKTHKLLQLGFDDLEVCYYSLYGKLQMLKRMQLLDKLLSLHDVINKWQKKIQNKKMCIVQPTTSSTLDVYNSRPPLATYMVSYLVP